jgi:L-threonine kinase
MAEARCPASCGELIQGWIQGGEKLVSCPVNWFSTVAVSDGAPLPTERTRMRLVLRAVLRHLSLPSSLEAGLRIEFESSIPVAKGMASSTADIAACAIATARHFGMQLTEKELASLCVGIEPTDSTIFQAPTLFDHQQALTQTPLHERCPEWDMLLLESPDCLRTEDYHRRPRQALLQEYAPQLKRAHRLLTEGMRENNRHKIGAATTLSAQASQALLPKPAFNDIVEIVEQHGLFGLNVAHSGSVVGLLLDTHLHDPEKIIHAMRVKNILVFYPHVRLLHTTLGGVR